MGRPLVPAALYKQLRRRRYLNKVFIGGIKKGTKKEEIEAHFGVFGTLTRIKFNEDETDENWRGFSFITYKEESSANAACKQRFQLLSGKKVEVKIAVPRMESNEMYGAGIIPYPPMPIPMPIPMRPLYSVPPPSFQYVQAYQYYYWPLNFSMYTQHM